MGTFIVANQIKRFAVGASDVDFTVPMPVLPLSCIFISIEANLITANTADNWITLLDQIKSIQFRYRGTQIWAVRGTDLYRMARALGVWTNRPENPLITAASRREIVLCLPFGRRLYDPNECFPGVNNKETELFFSMTAASGTYNTLKLTVDTLQLPDAKPKQFIRCTTINATPAGTGDQDFDLPRATNLVALGIVETNAEPQNTTGDIETIKILANNQDLDYSIITPMTARALSGLQEPMGVDGWNHTHVENTAAAYAQNAVTLASTTADSMERNLLYLPFDPLEDGQYLINGPSYQDLKVRINFNTAAAIRLLPVELFVPAMLFNKSALAGS